MKAIELKETSEDKATPFFWSTVLKTPCTVDITAVNVIVRKFPCGCKSIQGHHFKSNKTERELVHCNSHTGLPNPCAITAIEYYV